MTDADTLTPTDAATAGMEPVATVLFSSTGWRTLVDALASLEDGTKLYTAAQVQAMLAAVPRNAPLYSPDDVAFPVQRSADGTDVPPELASTARPASTAAVEVAAQPGWCKDCNPDNCTSSCATPAAPVDADIIALADKTRTGEPLEDSQIAGIYFEALGSQHLREQDRKMVMRFARAVESEVQKQDEALIRQMLAAREMYESQDDSLLLCASDLQHSAIYDNHIEMQSCIRAVADRITALASVIAGRARLESKP